jgi:hypothetical protein
VDLDEVVVRRGDETVARHARCLAPHRTITDPEHVRARRWLQSRKVVRDTPKLELEVEIRDLGVYDAALGAM